MIAGLVMAGLLGVLPGPAQDPPTSPEQALAGFRHDPAVRVELVASEPLVFDPVALCFDARGRLFVVENRGYPTEVDPPRGDVVLLEDTDGDGQCDRRTVFAEGFDFPNGIMAWKEGLLLTCAPDVYYLKDSDGDGRAEERESVLTGFAPGGSTQLRTSHPTLNVDGWIYFTNGLSGGDVRLPGQGPESAVKMGASDLRWNPWSGAIETTAGQAQFGQAFDELGNKYVCSNRKHIVRVMLQPADLARNSWLTDDDTVAEIPDHEEAAKLYPISSNITTAYSHTGTFTAACGLVVYRGSALGPGFEGNAFICDPTGNLIHRDLLEPAGAAPVARRAEEGREFLASPDNWFRPVFLANGPDGALYLCDMYRKTIEHPVYLPPEVAARTDFESGRDRGRIYRITGANAARQAPVVALDVRDTDELLDCLAAPDGWTRDTAFRLLLERRPEHLVNKARRLCHDNRAVARIYGLRLLAALGESPRGEVDTALSDDDARVRETALRLPGTLELNRKQLERLFQDPSSSVRFHAALASGRHHPHSSPGRLLAELALGQLEDPWLRVAALSSGAGDAEEFIATVLDATSLPGAATAAAFLEFAEQTGRMAGLLPAGEETQLVERLLADPPSTLLPRNLALLAGCLDAVSKRASAGEAGQQALAVFRERARATGLSPRLGSLARENSETAVLAVRVLGHFAYDEVAETLTTLLAPGLPVSLQLAAVQALGGYGDARASRLFAQPAAWNGFSGGVRAAARGMVLRDEDATLALLGAMERGEISPYTLDPDARGQLLATSNERLRDVAARVLGRLEGTDRHAVYEAYLDALQLPADPVAGHGVFTANCAQCHVYQGEGSKVGPELSDIRAQTREYILLHLIEPNRVVTAGYESCTVITRDLETYTGILAAQSDSSLTLRQALGVETRIARDDLESMTTENRSLMPDELEKGLSKQQMRDLIAFLRGEQ